MQKWITVLLSTFLAIGVASYALAQNNTESFIGLQLAGNRADFNVTVPAGDTDPETFIPVSVIKGSLPGPTVLMVTGVHGYEFAPILAAQRLADEIEPDTLVGTLIIVRVAHIPAFEERSPYVNPYDRKNLNRSFPGDPTGTQTERIAWVLSSKLIPAADFVLDVHSGDGAEWLEAFVGVYGGPLATDYASAFSFAEAMGFPNIVRYTMNTQEQIDRGRSLNRQAVAQGLPTILVEIGENGRRDPRHVDAIVSGIKRGMSGLEMLKPTHHNAKVPPRYFDGTQSIPVKNSGIWTPVSRDGEEVKAGETLGTIHNYKGRLVETVTAPKSGFHFMALQARRFVLGKALQQ